MHETISPAMHRALVELRRARRALRDRNLSEPPVADPELEGLTGELAEAVDSVIDEAGLDE